MEKHHMARTTKTLDVAALLAFHKAHFGDARMEAEKAGSEGEAPKPAPPAGAKSDEGKPQSGEIDWAAKFEAQQKVNRDLETKLNELRDGTKTQAEAAAKAQREALAKALGLGPDEATDADKLASQVTDLSDRLTELTKANLVLTIGKGLSEDDQALLAALPDEATMRTVAARLAKAAEGEQAPGFQPLGGQGQGGGKGPTLAQQVAEAQAEVSKHTPGTPEHKAAQSALMSLKTQQLAALKP
jgi:hypothetical protein